jgi:hypothetical protein
MVRGYVGGTHCADALEQYLKLFNLRNFGFNIHSITLPPLFRNLTIFTLYPTMAPLKLITAVLASLSTLAVGAPTATNAQLLGKRASANDVSIVSLVCSAEDLGT